MRRRTYGAVLALLWAPAQAQQRAVVRMPVPAMPAAPAIPVPVARGRQPGDLLPAPAWPGGLLAPSRVVAVDGLQAVPLQAPTESPGLPVPAKPVEAVFEAPAALEPGRWLPDNKERLERLIRDHGRGGPRWDPSRPPLATFDWDNTMIRNDIGEAVFYHAIREMRFKFELGDRFWSLIPAAYGRDELRASYESIAGLPPAQAKRTPQYRRYRKIFHRMYDQVKRDGASLHIDYGWLVQLMVGFTVPELEALADEVIALETSRSLGRELVAERDGDPDPVAVPTGIRVYPEMADLVRRLTAAGWEVRVVSATAEPVVARFAAALGIPRGRVHGARVRVDAGRLTEELTQRTWGQGKADTILAQAGRPSLLAGGDSNSDREMLELSQGERLVIDLGREPLRGEALSRGWLLQPPFLAADEGAAAPDAVASALRDPGLIRAVPFTDGFETATAGLLRLPAETARALLDAKLRSLGRQITGEEPGFGCFDSRLAAAIADAHHRRDDVLALRQRLAHAVKLEAFLDGRGGVLLRERVGRAPRALRELVDEDEGSRLLAGMMNGPALDRLRRAAEWLSRHMAEAARDPDRLDEAARQLWRDCLSLWEALWRQARP
ncbi:MAG: haloacid dehalogenase-like hydrolase [Elusimicrobia bacterium]|nr:haloacid dehalogenase-like hydrolase [Elusimicrobiota bacterium]